MSDRHLKQKYYHALEEIMILTQKIRQLEEKEQFPEPGLTPRERQSLVDAFIASEMKRKYGK